MHSVKPLLLTAVLSLSLNQWVLAQDGNNLPEGISASVDDRPIPQLIVDIVAQQLSASGQETDNAQIIAELIDMEVLTKAAEQLELQNEPELAATLQLQYTQTMANAYLARIGAEFEFSDEELKAEYELQSANVDRAEYRGSHILLESAEQAERLIQELTAGASFEDLAKEHSVDPGGENGGDLGWFQASTMPAEFSAAVAEMSTGDVSKTPVKTQYGYHIIKLNETRDAGLPDFQAVKTGLTNLAVRKALSEHVTKLRQQADIKQR